MPTLEELPPDTSPMIRYLVEELEAIATLPGDTPRLRRVKERRWHTLLRWVKWKSRWLRFRLWLLGPQGANASAYFLALMFILISVLLLVSFLPFRP